MLMPGIGRHVWYVNKSKSINNSNNKPTKSVGKNNIIISVNNSCLRRLREILRSVTATAKTKCVVVRWARYLPAHARDMPAKIVELTVELLVQAVSCPGVWLCPEGEVSLAVFALGCSHRTARLPPAFPLPYHDAFYFRKTFRNACSLNNLPAALAGESIYCELVQWKCENDGRVLAQYLGSLSDVLFPPDICSSDGVDLLMKTTSAFPGILSPKIEVSTKVRVDEVWDGSGQRPEHATVREPSPASRPTTDPRMQRTVCHSKPYHDARCSRSHLRPRSRHKPSQVNRCSGSDDDSEPGQSHSPDRRFHESAASAGGPRVARALESECGARRRGRRAPAEGGRPPLAAGPCVCEICRRYHELFHADRP